MAERRGIEGDRREEGEKKEWKVEKGPGK